MKKKAKKVSGDQKRSSPETKKATKKNQGWTRRGEALQAILRGFEVCTLKCCRSDQVRPGQVRSGPVSTISRRRLVFRCSRERELLHQGRSAVMTSSSCCTTTMLLLLLLLLLFILLLLFNQGRNMSGTLSDRRRPALQDEPIMRPCLTSFMYLK